MADLLGRCTFPPTGTPVVAAVSGGADSSALLILAAAADLDVTAVHVDHGLRPESGAEAEVVAELAARVGAGFRAERVVVEPGPNLEARARDARLAVLGPGSMTGHTADDQAETLVLALLRGAGLDGLSAMRVGATKPILALRRAETWALCEAAGVETVDDPSNRDPAFVRNRVRAEALPLLDDIAGRDVAPLLARLASLAADEADLLDEMARAVDPTDARLLAAAPPALARRAVRAWVMDAMSEPDRRAYPPSAAAVERVLAVARGEAVATEVGAGVRVERHQGRLSLHRVGTSGADDLPLPVDAPGPVAP